MKRIWYYIVRIYIRTGLFFYFKKIKVINEENIPKKGAILLVSNHKNALIDPLLIATTTIRNIHFLTRASAFKLKLVKWLLSTVNMLPIYRLRDGKETLAKNEEIFNTCFTLLNKKKALLIFPEGTHDIKRWVRPLSKGFTRIAFGVLEQNPGLNLHIVPVGLNYTDAAHFAESVSIYYGNAIMVNDYFNKKDINASTVQLKNVVSEKMKKLTTHIDSENYDSIVEQLGRQNFLDPIRVNDRISKLPNTDWLSSLNKKPSLIWKIVKTIVAVNSFIPLLIYKAIEPNIQEIEFVSTTKFAIGLTAFPLFYVLQSLLINHFFGSAMAIIYLSLSVILVVLAAKIK